MEIALIVGSPRSGTTILGEVLGRHPDIVQIYEPYFLWDFHHGSGQSDQRLESDASSTSKQFIRSEFERVLARSGKRLLVEKSPENSFRIPFVNAIFPNAKWIHMIRDGRDCVASIRRETEKRRKLVEGRNYRELVRLALEMIEHQPFWRNRWQAIWYEIKSMKSFHPRQLLNKSKFDGHPGWGPRFPGWQEAREVSSALQFCALQWQQSVQYCHEELATLIAPSHRMDIYYEKLVADPKRELARVFSFLDLPEIDGIGDPLVANFAKPWQEIFSDDELAEIAPIINATLELLGYPRIAPFRSPGQSG